ncbi:MAG: DMT family transporter [Candidatus Eisenbacteria bacterium]|nr:DMT family transporter [Candidatus Eisenbacteria bacterium]
MRNQTRAYLLALAAVLCWSTVATAFELTLRRADPLTMLFWSSLASTIFLFAYRRAREGGFGFPAGPDRGREWRASALNGLLNPFLYYTVLFTAYDLLPAQEAQPLNYTWPIVVTLLSAPMLGQRLRPASLLAVFLGFLGVLIISTHGDPLGFRFTHGPGALLAVGSSLVWALYWIRNVRDRRDATAKLSLGFLFGTLYVGIALFAAGRAALPSGPALLGSLYIGLFEMGLAFLLWLRALSLSETSARVSNLVYLSPFLSLVPIHYVVGEEILPSSVLGLVVIVLGIAAQKQWG